MVVQAETKEDANKIINKEGIKETFNVEEQKKRNPQIIVYNVESDLKDEEIVRKIINTNIDEEEEAQKAMRDTKVKFRTGPKNKRTCHAVIEVAPRTRELLMAKPRLYIKYTSHMHKDFLVVAKCFKCRDLGHTTRFCGDDEVCTHCGEKGHRRENCGKKINQPFVYPAN